MRMDTFCQVWEMQETVYLIPESISYKIIVKKLYKKSKAGKESLCRPDNKDRDTRR